MTFTLHVAVVFIFKTGKAQVAHGTHQGHMRRLLRVQLPFNKIVPKVFVVWCTSVTNSLYMFCRGENKITASASSCLSHFVIILPLLGGAILQPVGSDHRETSFHTFHKLLVSFDSFPNTVFFSKLVHTQIVIFFQISILFFMLCRRTVNSVESILSNHFFSRLVRNT